MGQNSQTTTQAQNQAQTSANNQTQNQAATTNPWANTLPYLQNIIQQIGAGGTPLTSPQSSALASLQSSANAVPNFGAAGAGATQNALSYSNAPQVGIWNQAYGNLQNTMAPYLDPNYLNPYTNATLQPALTALNQQIGSNIAGQFAGAGRDPAGNADASKAIALGESQAEAPLLLGQYNQNVAQQQGAANALYGAGSGTATGTAGLNTQALANQLLGIQAGGALPGLYTAPAEAQLGAANTIYGQPYQNTAIPQSLLTQLAGLGGQTTGTGTTAGTGTSTGNLTGTSTTVQPMNPLTTGLGLGLGLLGLGGSSLGGNLFSGLGSGLSSLFSQVSDARLKENIEPVGLLYNGLNVYRYNLRGSMKPQIGVMAQEVEQVNPDAVINVGLWPGASVKMVDYQKATQPTAMAA